jgi:hypothetical protein
MSDRVRTWLAFAVLLLWVIGILAAVPLSLKWWLFGPNSGMGDYTKKSPEKAFRRVFERPAPPGVSDIRAAGQVWLGGRNVWLRFRATDPAIRSLMAVAKRETDAQSIRQTIDGLQMEVALTATHPDLRRWRSHVCWDEVRRIEDPESYFIHPRAPSSTPNITLIIDRKRHLVYVYLFDI